MHGIAKLRKGYALLILFNQKQLRFLIRKFGQGSEIYLNER